MMIGLKSYPMIMSSLRDYWAAQSRRDGIS